jgi:hypothetical protein
MYARPSNECLDQLDYFSERWKKWDSNPHYLRVRSLSIGHRLVGLLGVEPSLHVGTNRVPPGGGEWEVQDSVSDFLSDGHP